ncbi:twitching motility protein PilT [Cellulomonas algicola]|uniref:Ribonuclease VapC n=1 Tax=Cellulomonas algicola TaxID=2071633 RepID=A0A401UXP3_9CELL|nr:type II toxin-antitoxin system VapC family toxin [Cellulomonas algicola]GCD19461.1 twitching motility protein PilT [Cellulomonas algicola]
MTYLLDTNVVAELRRREPDPSVVAWVRRHEAAGLLISVMTVYEIEVGILSVARRDPAQAARLREWLSTQVLVQFDGRIVPVDVGVATRAASLSVPDRRPYSDCLIAATALERGLAVVTRNVGDFAGVDGLAVVDPWRTV